MVVLTTLLTPLALLASFSITDRVKAYMILFLLLETGMLGVFMSIDLLVFFVFWEIGLVPMYFLINQWGSEKGERELWKGVKVQGEHLADRAEVLAYVREVLEKGIGGAGVVIEERVEGEEFTLQAFCDGKRVVPMPLVQDHKRRSRAIRGRTPGAWAPTRRRTISCPSSFPA
jgi:hypothetical protein